MIRLLLPVPSPVPERLTIRGERFHYVSHVLRLLPGATFEVFDGRGTRFDARVLTVSGDSAEISLGNPSAGVAGGTLTLVQGLPKGDKLELILQKGTELGITTFVPVATVRAVAKLVGDRGLAKRQRWQRIAEEAARQCGRSDVPQVLPPQKLIEAISLLRATHHVLILDEDERARRLSQAVHETTGGELAIVVGPEGGFDPAERAQMVDLGAIPVSLGPRILRTETAGLAAAAIVFHLRGELG